MQMADFRPARRRWPGLLAAGLIAAAVSALIVSSYYDSRPIGARIDASVAAAQSKVEDRVDDLRNAASGAAQGTAVAAGQMVSALGDTGITAAVKTALAADPSLSAVKIEVRTENGVVHLDGPAPNLQARERAEVLAKAPAGVVQVDNRLVVVP